MESFTSWDNAYLDSICSSEQSISKIVRSFNSGNNVQLYNFSQTYELESRKIEELYYDYLQYINEFYNNSYVFNRVSSFNHLDITNEEVLSIVNDFYKLFDPNWYKLFNNVYLDRYKNIKFDPNSNLSYSIFFSDSNKWLCNINNSNTIMDIVSTVHEYAHAIDDQINNGIRPYSPKNILLELFPYIMQNIFIYEYKEQAIELEKFRRQFNNDIVDMSQELLFKHELYQVVPKVNNARNLSRIISNRLNGDISKYELITMYSNSVDRTMSYVFSYIISQKLFKIYKQDKELFIYTMNKIFESENYPLTTLNSLGLIKR